MKKTLILLSLSTMIALSSHAGLLDSQIENKCLTIEKIKPIQKSEPKIQLAILIDTSGSMEGLINQVKTEIWKIINSLSSVTKNGEASS